jgi:hypothetical protein
MFSEHCILINRIESILLPFLLNETNNHIKAENKNIPSFSYRSHQWLWCYGSWIDNYLCNQCLSPMKLWVQIPLRRGVLDTTLCDKVQVVRDFRQVGGFLHRGSQLYFHITRYVLKEEGMNKKCIYNFWNILLSKLHLCTFKLFYFVQIPCMDSLTEVMS